MDDKELARQLDYFTGTEKWHRWSALAPNYVLTDGAKFLADNAGGGAYWLMDLIASYHSRLQDEPFQAWKLTVADSKATVTCEDGNENHLVTQEIEYTDFPMEEVTLWCIQDEYWVILLPSEY